MGRGGLGYGCLAAALMAAIVGALAWVVFVWDVNAR